MMWRPPVETRLSRGNPWARGMYKACAWIYGVLTAIMAVLAWQIPFHPATDFDITGFLFLIQNIPALFAWGVTIGFGAATVYCWTRMIASPPAREDPFS
jgi:hypothetical protein